MSDIISISRFRMGTDGKGIRTLVGFYGCPLKCKYCINHHCNDENIVRADYTANELIETLSIDEPYFLMSGGGISFGGGEPLLQADFIHEVCQKMNPKWNKVIETSLYAPWDKIELLVGDIDYWIIDIKDIHDDVYKTYTGKSNQRVIRNLHKLFQVVTVDKICIRVPLIPEYNNEELRNETIQYIQENINKEVKIDKFEYILC